MRVPFELKRDSNGNDILYAYGEVASYQKDYYIFGLLRSEQRRSKEGDSDLELPANGQGIIMVMSYLLTGSTIYCIPRTLEILLDGYRSLSYLGVDMNRMGGEMSDWVHEGFHDEVPREFHHEMFEIIGWSRMIKEIIGSKKEFELKEYFYRRDNYRNWPFKEKSFLKELFRYTTDEDLNLIQIDDVKVEERVVQVTISAIEDSNLKEVYIFQVFPSEEEDHENNEFIYIPHDRILEGK